MQGGLKSCPQCGNVNDSGNETCKTCGYNFATGEVQQGRAPILAEEEIPRIIADPSNIKRSPEARARRIVTVIGLLIGLGVVGFVGFIFLTVNETVRSATDGFEIDLPNGGNIEIPTDLDEGRTFTKASCTRAVSDGVAALLRRQSKGESTTDLFTKYAGWGIASFEYETLIEVFFDFETQSELNTGSTKKAIRVARKNAAQACARHYS